MSQYPIVSILMPMRNARGFVRKAIESVLAERSVPLELIVVDDRSDDGSANHVREIGDSRIRVIASEGEGIAAAFNTGLNAARGRYIARCDADDLYPHGRLKEQVAYLNEHKDVGAVAGGFAIMSPVGSVLSDLECGVEDADITSELCNGIVRTHFCCFMVRRDILRQLKGCRGYFKTGEDIDLQLRMGEVCKVWYQPKRRYLYRLHSDSVTHQLGGMLTGHYDWLARHLQAQRLGGMPDDLERNVAPPAPRSTLPQQSPLAKQIQGILLGTAWQQHSRGRKFQSILTGLRAGVSRPVDIAIWRSVAALVLKRSGTGMPEQFQVTPPHATGRPVGTNS